MKIVITGGHSGIGLELLKKLLVQENDIALIIKNPERIKVLPIKIQNHPRIKFIFGDLSVRDDIDRISKELAEHFPFVDILFNNAGVLLDDLYYSKQGNEMHFEVNTLAPYYLMTGISPLLAKSENGLVVNTLTDGLHHRKELDVADLLKPKKFKKLFGSYMKSKHALLLLMNDYAQQEKNFRIINVGPGPNKTNMTGGTGMPAFLKLIRNLIFPPPTKGANYLFNAAFNKDHESSSGIYLSFGKVRPINLKLSPTDKSSLLT
ncbi:MAG: SDR family oxidoreductase [Cyclobacteriaceae bacterium]|nr:SDR family oxidoreductase [Cyclobacteriaceae bacterium HetDA_MAG_MS6]